MSCLDLLVGIRGDSLRHIIEDQLTRSSTSACCNLRAVHYSQSRAAFIAKSSIVIEELDESCFWLELMGDRQLVKNEQIAPVLKEGKELVAILAASRITAMKNQKREKSLKASRPPKPI